MISKVQILTLTMLISVMALDGVGLVNTRHMPVNGVSRPFVTNSLGLVALTGRLPEGPSRRCSTGTEKRDIICCSGKSNNCQISNISCTRYLNLKVSHLVLQLSVCNLLKPGVKSRMKM